VARGWGYLIAIIRYSLFEVVILSVCPLVLWVVLLPLFLFPNFPPFYK